jgi:predicted secreted protein
MLKGREMQLYRGSTPALVANVRTKGLSISGEPIDVTTDDDDGVRKLLDDAAELAIEITVSGVAAAGNPLRAEAAAVDGRAETTEFRYGAVEKWAGSFFLSSYSENGEYKGAATFEATLVSAGAITYTPPA